MAEKKHSMSTINSKADAIQFTLEEEGGWNCCDHPKGGDYCTSGGKNGANGYFGLRRCDSKTSKYVTDDMWNELERTFGYDSSNWGKYTQNEIINKAFRDNAMDGYFAQVSKIDQINNPGVGAHLFDLTYWKPALASEFLSKMGGVNGVNSDPDALNKIVAYRHATVTRYFKSPDLIKSMHARIDRLAAMTGGAGGNFYNFEDGSKENSQANRLTNPVSLFGTVGGNWFTQHLP